MSDKGRPRQPARGRHTGRDWPCPVADVIAVCSPPSAAQARGVEPPDLAKPGLLSIMQGNHFGGLVVHALNFVLKYARKYTLP